MFIAHLPAGYLLTSAIQRAARRASPKLLAVGLLASIAPDFDLAYHYLIDHQQTLHHKYMSHWPLAWLAASGVAAAIALALNKRTWLLPIGIVLANGLLHMALDTVTSGIYWLAPFSDTSWRLFNIPARYGLWVGNFILHWTFVLELLIVLAAYLQWKRR
jgi:inner membrane protein